jgi:hypothetical protein
MPTKLAHALLEVMSTAIRNHCYGGGCGPGGFQTAGTNGVVGGTHGGP